MPRHKSYIARREKVEHHRGGDVPKGELVVQPKIPVDENVAQEIDRGPNIVSPFEIDRNVIKTSHDQPSGIDAQIATAEKSPKSRPLCQREPKAYAAEEEEEVDTDVAHAAKAEKGIRPGQRDVEENDEKNGQPHQFAAVSADSCPLKFFQLHLPTVLIVEVRQRNAPDDLMKQPCQNDRHDDVKQQSCVQMALMRKGDDDLSGNGVNHK